VAPDEDCSWEQLKGRPIGLFENGCNIYWTTNWDADLCILLLVKSSLNKLIVWKAPSSAHCETLPLTVVLNAIAHLSDYGGGLT